MHILCYIPGLTGGKGGAERVSVEMGAEMIARQHQVTFLTCSRRKNARPRYLLPAGSHYVCFRNRIFLKEYLFRSNPDVLFCLTSLNLEWLYAACRFLNVPTVLQEISSPQRILRLRAERLKLTIEQVSVLRQAFMSFFTCVRVTRPEYRQTFIPHLQPDVFGFCNAIQPARCLSDLNPPARKTIINVGGLKPAKNIFPLLEAFTGLADDFPNWDMVICGEGRMRAEVEAFLANNGLIDRVRLLGEVEDMYSLYEHCQLSVLTSLEEGNPLAICESMVHGIPSIGYEDCTGTNRLIKDHENGLLAKAGDRIIHLRECMRQLMANSEMRIRFGKQAYLDSHEFGPSAIYDQWEKMFVSASAYSKNPSRKLLERQVKDFELASLFQVLRDNPNKVHDMNVMTRVTNAIGRDTSN